MRRNIRKSAIFVLIALVFSGCNIPSKLIDIRGSGVIKSETRQVSGFDSIDFSGIGSLTIVQGSEEFLQIEAEDNLISHIESVVRAGKLSIEFKERINIIPSKDILFTLGVKDIKQLDVNGLGYVFSSQLLVDKLNVHSSGSSQVNLSALSGNELNVEISGAGIFKIEGNVDIQNIDVSGAGVYDAGNLQSKQARINISGAGSAILWVENALEVELSGFTALRYYGKPSLVKRVSGIARIEELGLHP